MVVCIFENVGCAYGRFLEEKEKKNIKNMDFSFEKMKTFTWRLPPDGTTTICIKLSSYVIGVNVCTFIFQLSMV